MASYEISVLIKSLDVTSQFPDTVVGTRCIEILCHSPPIPVNSFSSALDGNEYVELRRWYTIATLRDTQLGASVTRIFFFTQIHTRALQCGFQLKTRCPANRCSTYHCQPPNCQKCSNECAWFLRGSSTGFSCPVLSPARSALITLP